MTCTLIAYEPILIVRVFVSGATTGFYRWLVLDFSYRVEALDRPVGNPQASPFSPGPFLQNLPVSFYHLLFVSFVLENAAFPYFLRLKPAPSVMKREDLLHASSTHTSPP